VSSIAAMYLEKSKFVWKHAATSRTTQGIRFDWISIKPFYFLVVTYTLVQLLLHVLKQLPWGTSLSLCLM
jgi:hypothetical protein